MKIFANNKIWKKIVIIIGILLSFSIVTPEPVQADLGGTLMQPVMSLFIGIGDGINTVIQKMFLEQEPTILIISDGVTWWKVVLGVAIGVCIAVIGIVTSSWIPIVIGAAWVLVVSITSATGEAGGDMPIAYQVITEFTASMLSDKGELALPMIQMSPYEIFANEGGIFSVNFFKDLSDEEKYTNKEHKNKTLVYSMQDTIASWYKKFRLIAIIGMLPVLTYIGIRILLSAPGDKAKYKENLMDWGIAFLLIFAMHYIMSFSNLIIDDITDMIVSTDIKVEVGTNDGGVQTVSYKDQSIEGFLIGVDKDKNYDNDTQKLIGNAYKKLKDELSEKDFEKYKWRFWKDLDGNQATSDTDAKVLFWPCDNFLSQSRMYAQMSKGNFAYIGYGLIYIILTIYTGVFIFVYLRRYIYMAFLTLISPLVALTYPLDKLRDGKAQAFEFWFKEYFYNLLLQPLHLLLYMILVGTAMNFAAKHPIYVCVILGFMIPFEKLLKQMFGFRGETPGAIPGMAAGALMMEASHRIFGRPPRGPGGGGGPNNPGNAGGEEPNQIKMKDVDASGGNLIDGPSGSGGGSGPSGSGGGSGPSGSGGGSGPSGSGGGSGPSDLGGGGGPSDLGGGGGPSDLGGGGGPSDLGGGSGPSDLGDGSGPSDLGGGSGPSDLGGGSGPSNLGGGSGTPNLGSGSGTPNLGSGSGTSSLSVGSGTPSSSSGSGTRRRIRVPGFLRYPGKAIGRYFKYNGKNLAKSAGTSAIRFAGGAAAGIVGATGGLIAGVVSGDPSKAATYITGGGAAGYSLGSKATKNIPGLIGSQANAIANEYYLDNPDKYEEKQIKDQRKEWLRNKENMNTLKLNGINYKDLNKNGDLNDYIDHGFNAKQIVAAEKMIRENGFNHEQVMTIASMADKYYEGVNGVDSGKYENKMKENLRASARGKNLSDEQLNATVQASKGYMKTYHENLDNVKTLK